jgi:hypothetical protein
VLQLFGDIGGLIAFFSFPLAMLIPTFSKMKIHAILASKAYQKKNFIPYTWSNKKEETSKSDEITAPHCLELAQLLNFVLCCCSCSCSWCCCSLQKKYKDYEKVLGTVEKDVNRTLDIITILRRFRMHGICLNYLMGKPVRDRAAIMAQKRPL